MTRLFVLALMLATAACGGGSGPTAATPVTASPPTPAPPPPPAVSTISGTLTATNGGQPLGGIAVSIPGVTTTTDGGGQFSVTAPVATTSATIEFSGASIVPRRLTLATRTRSVGLDAIQLASGFSLNFYRQLVRNGFEQPDTLQPLRRWTENPRIYLRTVFGATNRDIDVSTLDSAAAALTGAVAAWTGGRLGVALIERGTDSREAVPGWITVVWNEALGDGRCGQAFVGRNPNRIDLHPRNAGCRCPGDPGQISRSVVVHEVGHAMGYWHTDSRADAMYDTFNSCNGNLSERERLHTPIAYSRPAGNTDPDTDPSSAIALVPSTTAVR